MKHSLCGLVTAGFVPGTAMVLPQCSGAAHQNRGRVAYLENPDPNGMFLK